MTSEQQQYLLSLIRQMGKKQLPPGVPGQALIEALDQFSFSPGEVDSIMKSIQEAERIDWDGWQ